MALHSDRNLYPGINAHLNSFLQDEGAGWESFHAEYIVQLRDALDQALPEGYYAMAEKSLQISEVGLDFAHAKRTVPDLSIYRTGEKIHSQSTHLTASPIATLPLAALIEPEDDYDTAIVIYEVLDGKVPGTPVTRIELLSPGNKPSKKGYALYMTKRTATLRSGLFLVEIDFLHEQRPVIFDIPSYHAREEGAFPYTVIISKPQPTLEEGLMEWYGWRVLDPLPIIPIPLTGNHEVPLDLMTVYNHLFERIRVFRMIVDYDQQPVHFDRYVPEDQKQIQQFLEKIPRGK